MARGGESLVTGNPISLPDHTIRNLRLRPSVSPDAFRIACPSPSARIRVMELLNTTITREVIQQVSPEEGSLGANQNEDLLKIAVFDRHGESGRVALGFLKGFGARVGAVGTTVNLDENSLVIVGSDNRDMALCANALIEMGGGMTVVDRGVVLEKIAFPVGGIFSLDPWREVGKGLRKIHRCLREKGSPYPKPIYPICFLTFVTIPSLRITDRGLVRVKDRRLVPLFVEG